MLYSHDGLGLGHTRRNINIASALVASNPEARCLLVSGSDDVFRFSIPNRVEVLKLPGIRKIANDQYEGRRDFGRPDEVVSLRSGIMEAAVRSFSPHMLLVDKHPLGVGGELLPSLQTLARSGGTAFLGLRDILDDPVETKKSWAKHRLLQVMRDHYSGILVYGQEDIWDIRIRYGIDPWNGKGIHYTGYVGPLQRMADPSFCHEKSESQQPLIIVSVGGGEDGTPLLDAAISANLGSSCRTVVIGGPQASKVPAGLASGRIEYHHFVSEFPTLIQRASALICMGGYNTLTEAMMECVPTVCIPRIVPRTEQVIRAEAFAKAGLLRMIHPDMLTTSLLRHEVEAACSQDRNELCQRITTRLQLGGAEAAARTLLDHFQTKVA